MSEKPRKRSIFDIMGEYTEEFDSLTDELLESAFPEGPSWNTEKCCLEALSNVFVTSREVIVTADMPNIDPETVKVETAGSANHQSWETESWRRNRGCDACRSRLCI